MDSLSDLDPAIRDNLISMLDIMALRLREKDISQAEYSRTLNFLRFKIGEDLYDTYASIPRDMQRRAR